jgi:recombinational DNA repair ATPase RecF
LPYQRKNQKDVELDFWDRELVKSGEFIISKRKRVFWHGLMKNCCGLSRNISEKETLTLEYKRHNRRSF